MKTMIFAILFVLAATTNAQVPPVPAAIAGNPTSPQPVPEPIMAQFKRTVISIETDCLVKDQNGQHVVPYLGTGFLVSHHDARYPSVGGFNYLVTNRHVATPGAENNAPCTVSGYGFRVNTRTANPDGSKSELIRVQGAASWIFPTDNSTDLAVMPFGLDPNKYLFMTFQTDLFLTTEQTKQRNVVEGDSVVFTGLFVQFMGQMMLEPIVREGRIAMIPSEPVPTTLRSTGEIYLVDAHVFGGNSGSPMLVNLGGQRDNGLTAGFEYHLLGLVSGYVQETSDFKLQPVASYAGTVSANSGVATVVPAQKILDLLNVEVLQNHRAAVFASARPTPALQ